MDDNFCSIFHAILHSRNFVDSILKFLQFSVTFTMVICLFIFIGACITGGETLSALQLYWAGFVVNLAAPLAFAFSVPNAHQYRPRESSFEVSAVMWRNIIGQVPFQLLILIILVLKADVIFGFETFEYSDPLYPDEVDMLLNPERVNWTLGEPTNKLRTLTIAFQTLIFMQLFSIVNSRKFNDCNVFENFLHEGFCPFFLPVLLIIMFGIQMLLVGFGGRLMSTYPLTIQESAICLAIASSTLVWGLIFRAVPASYFACLVTTKTP